jgi:hypothetical protein
MPKASALNNLACFYLSPADKKYSLLTIKGKSGVT